ncbi:MSC_0623 family F1-like ATPase-associated protein [Mycoplasmopsis agassizii]|uniref:DUF2714 domain-containing protein n=1 Tax=Mycoplasmopsis agassizii TaxID=33922 RepID=A0ABX4H5A0_9BACT|nr:DUF2714 domain-containing protein [Mycoplasmopsis agassizii]PAF55066.1 DUF2714 domain-containing protein [Mycoplasmopsis agassizii]SMC19065.1 Protein of unknown function [Mycoplasmopsis agassizii]
MNLKNRNQKIKDVNFKEIKINTKYDELVILDNFVSFNQLLGTSLLITNISDESDIVKNLNEKINEAIFKNKDIVFEKFVISWSRNLRFSFNKLFPTLDTKESSNSESFSMKSSSNSNLDKLLKIINLQIQKYLFTEERYIEVIKGIIVFLSPDTKSLKIVFDRNIVNLEA